mgnify:CR=1 FL=1
MTGVQTCALPIFLDKPIDDITKEDRQLAKAVNFGLLYGQSAKGLVAYAKKAYGVEMEYERARDIRGRFFSAYTGLWEWHKNARRMAAEGAQNVRTALGRNKMVTSRRRGTRPMQGLGSGYALPASQH